MICNEEKGGFNNKVEMEMVFISIIILFIQHWYSIVSWASSPLLMRFQRPEVTHFPFLSFHIPIIRYGHDAEVNITVLYF